MAPRSPALTPCDFFLWGYVNDKVYVPPMSTALQALQERITADVTDIEGNILLTVWTEMDYRWDVCRVTKGAHIDHLYFNNKYVIIKVIMGNNFIFISDPDPQLDPDLRNERIRAVTNHRTRMVFMNLAAPKTRNRVSQVHELCTPKGVKLHGQWENT
ncbi:hypothetical protein AVEN_63404-1 [Araneus ventricosus]|uniref:Uncharacterized protein n=1 Tax=Araneus ventricosus TaxID=182803 RepID=A0A4Y2T6E0_ARAVE|nr:hypothetical protein AVEN_63404-1 [Araneus ventricosus]